LRNPLAAKLLAAATALAGCAVAPDPNSLDFDPLEQQNREAHAATVAVDRAAFGPIARGYGTAVPAPVRQVVTNVRNNWRLPGNTIQYVLQGRGVRAAEAGTRFAVNTVFGLGGLVDPASEMGLPYRETNFDETFYVWGVPEGAYWELPVFGPGTQRDWTGWALDQMLDPAYYLLPVGAGYALVALGGLDIVNDRYELDPVVDELYYRSPDGYQAVRTSYLQNMRARLQGGTDVGQLEDVYADF
jgi:phospholipid-binding lipoprotein MlaA